MRARKLVLALLLTVSCGGPDLPATDEQLNEFWAHTDWQPREDVQVDVGQRAPGVLEQFALSRNVGQVKVIAGDSTNVSDVTTPEGPGYGLRMDSARQDLARISRQVVDEEGDHFDFVVVFPTFQDGLNAGFAYYALLKNDERGIGIDQLDISSAFGSNGRLAGLLNMNRPQAYTGLDGKPIDDPQSVVHPVMGQEMTHRWLAHAHVKKAGFNGGEPSDVLLGRDDAHWSALMHTGAAGATGAGCSVQDGIAWVDRGNGSFTIIDSFNDPMRGVSPTSRFSSLDLYLMGLRAPFEVDPFFVITGGRHGSQPIGRTDHLTVGTTITGTREDFTVEHVVAALGTRTPAWNGTPRRFNLAFVVITQPGQSIDDAAAIAAQVEGFRTAWEARFAQWTGDRASLCTRLDGCAAPPAGGGSSSSSSSSSGGGSLPPVTEPPPNTTGPKKGCNCGPDGRPEVDSLLVAALAFALRPRRRA